MEHIIQIAVSVDDDRIEALAEKAAANELVKRFIDDTGRYRWRDRMQEAVTSSIIEALSGDGYSEIAEAVAVRLSRSQKFRDKVAEAYRDEER